jgi:hypothetical protein
MCVYKLDFFLIRGLLVNFMNVIKQQNKNSTNCYHIWLEQRIYVSIKKYFFTPRKLASPNLNEFTVLYNSLYFKIILHSYFTTLSFDICFTLTHLHHMIFNYEILCCSLLTMSIHDEGHWWRSFHTPVVCTKLDTYVFASKTLSNLHSFTWSFDSSCMTSERSYHSGCTRSEESMSYFWTLERIWHEKKSNIKFRSWISYDVGGWVWNKYQN